VLRNGIWRLPQHLKPFSNVFKIFNDNELSLSKSVTAVHCALFRLPREAVLVRDKLAGVTAHLVFSNFLFPAVQVIE
jgi:hypothetical protein